MFLTDGNVSPGLELFAQQVRSATATGAASPRPAATQSADEEEESRQLAIAEGQVGASWELAAADAGCAAAAAVGGAGL